MPHLHEDKIKFLEEMARRVAHVGVRHHLDLVILYGSYAKGTQAGDSDLDIAILRREDVKAQEFMDIVGELSVAIGEGVSEGIDLVLLAHADPLLRRLIARDGLLLYGDTANYTEFKALAFRDFMESEDLRGLEDTMIRAKQTLLARQYGTTFSYA
ncbi:MAG: nucleotidyltransferase domain-containing protein [Candidatus Sungbacteria bacterium]|nr:nucleotidyltransferase domain-containing protein [Candidatus Sungbacteria bacterium]